MLTLDASFVGSPLTRALVEGRVRPKGMALRLASEEPKGGPAAIIERNSKRMVALELDIAEMSFGTFICARDQGMPIVALPVFPGRRFPQPGIFVLPEADIQTPADLRGRSAAVGQFWQSAYVWQRLVLHVRYGVTQDMMSWVCVLPERWHALPEPNVRWRLETNGRDAVSLLRAGEVDVAFSAATSLEAGEDRVRRLFSDYVRAQREFFLETGIFPIIHLVAVREELAQDAAIVRSLCEAFEESKQLGLEDAINSARGGPIFGGDPAETRATFGADPWPYGIEANRKTLDPYLDDVCSHQHLTTRRLELEDLFPAGLPARFW